MHFMLITVSDQSHDLCSVTFLLLFQSIFIYIFIYVYVLICIYTYSDLYCTVSSFTTTNINHLFFPRISFPDKKNLLNIHNILLPPYLSADSSKVINLASYTFSILQTRSSFICITIVQNEIFHLGA